MLSKINKTENYQITHFYHYFWYIIMWSYEPVRHNPVTDVTQVSTEFLPVELKIVQDRSSGCDNCQQSCVHR